MVSIEGWYREVADKVGQSVQRRGRYRGMTSIERQSIQRSGQYREVVWFYRGVASSVYLTFKIGQFLRETGLEKSRNFTSKFQGDKIKKPEYWMKYLCRPYLYNFAGVSLREVYFRERYMQPIYSYTSQCADILFQVAFLMETGQFQLQLKPKMLYNISLWTDF